LILQGKSKIAVLVATIAVNQNLKVKNKKFKYLVLRNKKCVMQAERKKNLSNNGIILIFLALICIEIILHWLYSILLLVFTIIITINV